MSGPRRATLEGFRHACRSGLFSPTDQGHWVLTASKARLARALGVAPSSLNDRLASLARVPGALVCPRPLTLDPQVIEQALSPTVVALRPRHGVQLARAGGQPATAAAGRPAAASGPPEPPRAGHHQAERVGGAPAAGTLQAAVAQLTTLVRDWPDGSDAGLQALVDAVVAVATRLAAAACTTSGAPSPDAPAESVDAADWVLRKSVAQPAEPADFRRPSTDYEVELEDSPQPQSPWNPQGLRKSAGAAGGDAAAGGRPEQPGEPAAVRDLSAFGQLPDWQPEQWAGLVAPLERAWQARTGSPVRIAGRAIVQAARGWPRALVEQAVVLVAADVTAGRPIVNPGAVLCAALRHGWHRYLPPTSAPEQPAGQAQLGELAARWQREAQAAQAAGVDVAGLADHIFACYGRPQQHCPTRLAVALAAAAAHQPALLDAYARDYGHHHGLGSGSALAAFMARHCARAGFTLTAMEDVDADVAERGEAAQRPASAAAGAAR